MSRLVTLSVLGAALLLSACVAAGAALAPPPADARIARIGIVRVEPAFGGQAFGAVGAYERVIARAHGELDPAAGVDASIQDIGLAPRTAGRVPYVADLELLRPYVPETGKIVRSRITGTNARYQRKLSTAIKRARFLALLPYSDSHQ